MSIDFSKIKLVIWDLDETFWNGVLSEGSVSIPKENIQLINDLTNSGVICSICSKNDPSSVNRILKENCIESLFVFTSVNWSPKGERINQIISEMNLRAVNVLFIDDNFTNREEADNYNPGLISSDVDIIPEMVDYFAKSEKKDKEHKRLKQYKTLEKKVEFKAEYANNEEFLYHCHIRVSIHKNALMELDRISELVLRTNQLNFTKIRSSKEELKEVIQSKEYECGYVSVEDDFGNYGIVGFFAIRNNIAEHFLFSCRTLNMGVEQYVYNVLGRPRINIVPDVSSSLDGGIPNWINQRTSKKENKKSRLNGKILIKGPCDMEQMFSFIEPSKNIITEFTYINDEGTSIEHYNHTTQIINSLILNAEDKQRLSSLPFCDKNMFSTSIWDSDIEVVMLSLFNDPHLGIYREKATGILMAFGEYLVDYTDENNWDGIINKQYFTANHQFTKDELRHFKEEYEYTGRLTPSQILDNLKYILSKLTPDSLLVLCLGSEINIDSSEYKNHESYIDRHIFHKELNDLVKKWAAEENRVKYIDVNNYVNSREDFLDTINHMIKPVYYNLSNDFINIVNSKFYGSISEKKKPRSIDNIKKHIKQRIKYIIHGEK